MVSGALGLPEVARHFSQKHRKMSFLLFGSPVILEMVMFPGAPLKAGVGRCRAILDRLFASHFSKKKASHYPRIVIGQGLDWHDALWPSTSSRLGATATETLGLHRPHALLSTRKARPLPGNVGVGLANGSTFQSSITSNRVTSTNLSIKDISIGTELFPIL